jgi:hypothetical protein
VPFHRDGIVSDKPQSIIEYAHRGASSSWLTSRSRTWTISRTKRSSRNEQEAVHFIKNICTYLHVERQGESGRDKTICASQVEEPFNGFAALCPLTFSFLLRLNKPRLIKSRTRSLMSCSLNLPSQLSVRMAQTLASLPIVT